MTCPSCGSANEAGRKFCGACGSSLAAPCPSCGAPNSPTVKFCGECGSALSALAAQPQTKQAEPQAERRLVSVLFADLVGFTTLSETRDSEEVRELLSRYFEAARTIIARYGGTVEKFIGDAVMAVWGAPVANEDDAERAVRAGLELVSAVAAFGAEVGAPSLAARAGVLTGEAAVTIGAAGQGMVAGDLVNTASRVQSAAQPGTVLVGETTKRASEAAIVYDEAGAFELKGKAEPVSLWRAARVVAARGGGGRTSSLEAPFVGRDRELRVVKDVFHAVADERRAHLLSVVGVAGIGKTRLGWEFEKYIDGLADAAWWQRGRCLAYGEGVAYWALAEMVRMRARIAEDEQPETALTKLGASLEEIVLDPEERAFVEPRLQHLLSLTERTAPDKADLFSAWRLFFERMADQDPVILLFEDVQWADVALVEFVEHLMDRSRNHPILVLTLSRPDVAVKHATWGSGIRSFTSLSLEPLADSAMDELLLGLVPGLPDDARARIRDRAEGIPLYAVETVRMLLDRGLLEPGEGGYRIVGDLGELDVPETLQSLIAARLDGLSQEERRLLQDASVLGKTFAPRGLAVLSGLGEDALGPLLDGLVRKELLIYDSDPRSPERGQYGFLQALVQRVAYETLARRDRRERHLAAARYLSEHEGLDPDEIAEVIAAHVLDAIAADEQATDVAELRSEARSWLERAGHRATSLAAAEDARRAFEAAAGMADDQRARAELLERAGDAARRGNEVELGERLLGEARDLYTADGDTHAAARATAGLSLALYRTGRTSEAITIAEEAYAALSSDEPDADVAALAAELGRLHLFAGHDELALQRVDEALDVAESKSIPTLLSGAMNTKGLILGKRHPTVGYALLREALAIALDHDLVFEALRAYNNLGVSLDALDRFDEIPELAQEALELARRRGDREWENVFTCIVADCARLDGRWDESLALVGELDSSRPDLNTAATVLLTAEIPLERDRVDDSRSFVENVAMAAEDDADRQWRTVHCHRRRVLATVEGRLSDAIAAARESVSSSLDFREGDSFIAEELRAIATLLPAIQDTGTAEAVLAQVHERSSRRPSRQLTAQLERVEGVLAGTRGDPDAAVGHFALALAAARSLGVVPLYVAEILVDYADALVADGRGEEAAPLLVEARAFYEGVGAVRSLARIEKLEHAGATAEVRA